MKNFFSHDEGARNDPKLIKVLMKLGQEGKGVYWDLVEMLYEQDGYLMRSDCDSYAFALRTKSEIIESLINDFLLFEHDATRFWSNSVLRRLDFRKEKSQKASESASKRWENANALRSQCEGNAIKGKESKGKEKKENKKGVKTPEVCERFEQFWETYGKKEDHKKCLDYWQKLTPSEQETVLTHAPAYVKTKPDVQYRKYPLTYINGEVWKEPVPHHVNGSTIKQMVY